MAAVRVGVIGAGWWATEVHIPAVAAHPDASVTAIADLDVSRLQTAADAFSIPARFASPDELVNSGLVDAVVVATSHASHYGIAAAVLEAGLHVLVEKPMTLRAHDAWDLVAAADRRGLHLVVGYTHQFTKHAAFVREALGSGAIGELRLVSGLQASMVESFYLGRAEDYRSSVPFSVAAPRADTYADATVAGGGQGQTQLTHAVGMMLWVTGERVSSVSAQLEGFGLPLDLVDAVTFRLESGIVGTMASTGTVSPGQPPHLALHYFGTNGYIVHDIGAGTIAIRGEGLGDAPAPLAPNERHPTAAPVRCLIDLVTGAVMADANAAPGEAGARAVELIEAAYASAARDGAAVSP